jgi:hypothetical protein
MTIDRVLRAILDRDLVSFGSTSDDWINDPDRMARCHDAAEHGADGSTHQEAIEDMRATFRRSIPSRCERLSNAADRYCNELDAWHDANGSLFQEIG